MYELGQGFTLANPLEKVDIENDSTPSPAFVNKDLKSDFREKMVGLLREFVGCFAWSYIEMTGLRRELVEHRLPNKPVF